jgi:hypothetical protein
VPKQIQRIDSVFNRRGWANYADRRDWQGYLCRRSTRSSGPGPGGLWPKDCLINLSSRPACSAGRRCTLATAFAITPVDIDLCGLTTAPSMDAGADNAFGQMLQSAQTAVPNIASADVAEGHMINALQVGQCAAEPSRAWAGAAFASHRAARLTGIAPPSWTP